jgi:nicotinamide mononucleotide transporter
LSFLQNLLNQFLSTPLLEWIAFVFALGQVVLALFNTRFNFVAGIVSVSLYTWLFYTAGLFAESMLNAYYLGISIWGILYWKGGKRAELKISNANSRDWLTTVSIVILAWCCIYYVLVHYTTSTVPLQDALVASIAWAGTWLLLKRKVENWIVLNISNCIAIPLQYYKGLELTALLTVIYVVVAIFGFFSWQKKLQENIPPKI